ncbi:MAG: deoxyguanosinetriphosphate triphosphohydrolase [Planctomycetes bacterium]|nr:deoxyguanosinetriphosphate triphosphohydrolase [Planctomycetota bacterium]
MGNGSDTEAETGRIVSREQVLAREDARLAPYACRGCASNGRRMEEPPDPLRTDFQRDRDRIIHSTAFRRLNGKTQVFVADTGDHYRTRLTHSLEVSQIARAISRSLSLNEDLTEALALAHDLGHTPFGHSGGDVLGELMSEHGGFEHNRQALRILDVLEVKYPDFGGLNLTYEVRESIIKHKRPFEGEDYAPYRPDEGPCLEAQVVDLADGIAYLSADLDDGLRSGILKRDALDHNVGLWEQAREEALARYPGTSDRLLELKVVAQLISLLVRDLCESTGRRLAERQIASLEDVRLQPDSVVAFSPDVLSGEVELRKFLYDHFYTHFKVCRMRNRARVMITGLFRAYREGKELMPPRFQSLADTDGLERVVADYVSGMTDRYAQKEYGLLFQPGEGSLDA